MPWCSRTTRATCTGWTRRRAIAARVPSGKVRISNPPVVAGNMLFVINDAVASGLPRDADAGTRDKPAAAPPANRGRAGADASCDLTAGPRAPPRSLRLTPAGTNAAAAADARARTNTDSAQ